MASDRPRCECGADDCNNGVLFGDTGLSQWCCAGKRHADVGAPDCSCGEPSRTGLTRWKSTDDASWLRCEDCYRKVKREARRIADAGLVCAGSPDGVPCGLPLSATRKKSELECSIHKHNRLCGWLPCPGPDCVEFQYQDGLCNGHYGQWYEGRPLTPLWSTFTMREYDGCALYLFRGVLSNGATIDVFGVTERDAEKRIREYACSSRGRPGLSDLVVHGWFRWDDKSTSRAVENEIAEFAVVNSSLRPSLRTESWPADDGKVRDALDIIASYKPDYASN